MTRTRQILLSALVVAFAASAAGVGTYAAFSSTTENAGNAFAAGTVAIGDNDAGAAMLSLTNARPGASDTGCIKLTYTGSLSSTVRLYGTVTGSLAPYLTLTVTRGTDPTASFDSCATFSADATNYIGAGAGVIWTGALATFPSSYGSGIVDPTSATPESWTTSETHSYKFVVSLNDDNAAQGFSSTAGFTWEARNE